MVSLGRAACNLLLVGEVLLAVEQVQRADRRLVVAAPSQGRGQDPQPAPKRHVVGPGPTCPRHRSMYLRLVAAQTQIHRVPEQAVTGTGSADEISGYVKAGQNAMHPWQQEIRKKHPEHDEKQHWPTGLKTLLEHQVGQPDGRQTGEREQQSVHFVRK